MVQVPEGFFELGNFRKISLFTLVIQVELEVVDPELAARYENYIRHQTGIISEMEGLGYLAQVDKLRAEGKLSTVAVLEKTVENLMVFNDSDSLQKALEQYKKEFKKTKD